MVIPVLGLVFLIVPTVPVQLGKMLHTGIHYQVTPLLYPAQLQVDTVDDSQLLVRIPEVIQTALKPLVFA